MKTTLKMSLVALLFLTTAMASAGDETTETKKVQSFTISRIINIPADQVWKHIADDFTDIAKAHPGLSESHHLEGSPTSGEGCERVCYLNDDHTKYTKEVQRNYNKSNYSFDAQIFELGGIPMDESVSVGHYKIVPIDDKSCKLVFTMEYRTNPAFMGAMMKGKMKSQLSDYLLAIDHYLNTGEQVNKENFKAIKKQYKS